MVESSYGTTLRHLYGLRRFGMRPGLESISALLAELGNPQRAFRSVHVTGSKGKGSTAAMTAAVLQAAGLRTGLFTSPHLVSYRERIRVDGVPIGVDEVVEGIARIEEAVGRLTAAGRIDREPTFFEVTTALAFDRFRAAEVDAAVVEVGIGGRLDSTNVLDAPVAVITTLELEHTEILGPTLAAIASEKAGILRAGQQLVTGELPEEGREVVERSANALGVPVWHLAEEIRVGDRSLAATGQTFEVELPHRKVPRLKIPLQGRFQPGNAALAVAAADRFQHALGNRLTDAAIRKGLAHVVWRGRLERWASEPDLFVDVAHTPESVRAVAESLAEIAPMSDASESAVLFGCLAEKRVEEMLEVLSVLAQTVVVVPVSSSRSAAVAELARCAHGRFPKVVQAGTASDGLRLARAATGDAGLTLVVGSDYLVGELLREREPPEEEEPDLSDPGMAGDPATPSRRSAAGSP
jgi:dihydrofolate synthase / folylpolyglutamate synthase